MLAVRCARDTADRVFAKSSFSPSTARLEAVMERVGEGLADLMLEYGADLATVEEALDTFADAFVDRVAALDGERAAG
jgi:hypothetical protein